ncbi:hypothetical protein MPER_03914, partial [Moniliophthora perniciosa FA553]
MAKPKDYTATAPKTSATTQRTKLGGAPLKYYLVFYNVLSTIGWSYILIFTLIHVFNLDGNASALPLTSTTASSTLSR